MHACVCVWRAPLEPPSSFQPVSCVVSPLFRKFAVIFRSFVIVSHDFVKNGLKRNLKTKLI